MASRALVLMAVFFLSMNLFAGMLASTGVAADLGLQTAVGGDEAAQESLDATKNVSTGAPTGSTLFGAYNVLAGTVSTIGTVVTAGPSMLERAGVPDFITDQLLTPLIGLAYALGLISVFLRYRL